MSGIGPKRIPNKLHILHGNPGHRPLRKQPEFKISKDIPKPAKTLSPLARKEWRRIAPEFHKMGLLPDIQIRGLEIYCENYATWVRMMKRIRKDGFIITNENTGFIRPHFLLNEIDKIEKRIKQYLTEYGMTPASQSKVQPKEQSNENDLSKFLDDNK